MRGKEWECLVGQALGHAGAKYATNSNSEKPACDWRALVCGRSLLVECKDTALHRLPFSVITTNERRHLDRHMQAGGYSLILVSRHGPNWRRAWACWWWDWLLLEEGKARSISLDAPPECLAPLAWVERENGLGGTWDLRPIFGSICPPFGGRLEDS